MARAPLLVELESEFNARAAEERGHKDLTEYYTSLLTGASRTAQSYAQTSYAAEAQTAAEQASYDISGAYANYLKQQRNIASQGRLESGHKEELSGVLGEQYESAYSQAKATQAGALMSAKKTAQDLYSDIYGELSKSATEQIEAIQKQSEIKANLANAMLERAQTTGDKTFEWFDVNDENKTVLSDWGYDQLSKYLMTNADDFTKYLTDKGLEDELKYYLSAPADVRNEFFGITDTAYDALSESSIQRRLSAVADVAGEKVYYIDTIQAPELDVNWNDFSNWDVGVTGHRKMLEMSTEVSNWAKEQLGLSDDEIKQAFGYDLETYKNVSANEILEMELAEAAHYLKTLDTKDRDAKKEYKKIIGQLKSSAKTKYVKE
jgi:hypothetical protein